MPLNPRQQRFVEEYLIDLNATAAYKRAGYAAAGNAAEVNAHRLLRDAKVSAAIAVRQAERSANGWLTQEYVLTGLQREADKGGAAGVAALKLLGLHLGMFEQKIKVATEHTLRVKYVLLSDRPAGSAAGDPAAPGPAQLPGV